MSDQKNRATDGNLGLLPLIRRLERSAGYKLRRQGCVKPEQCGHDIVQDLTFGKNCEVVEDEIRINYPEARIPEAMLRKELDFAVSNKKRKCKDCKHGIIPIIDDREFNHPSSGPISLIPIDPANPETLLQEMELIERVLAKITDERRRNAFRAHVLYGYSHEEIARSLDVNPSRVRQWFKRDLAHLREEFPNLVSLWAIL